MGRASMLNNIAIRRLTRAQKMDSITNSQSLLTDQLPSSECSRRSLQRCIFQNDISQCARANHIRSSAMQRDSQSSPQCAQVYGYRGLVAPASSYRACPMALGLVRQGSCCIQLALAFLPASTSTIAYSSSTRLRPWRHSSDYDAQSAVK